MFQLFVGVWAVVVFLSLPGAAYAEWTWIQKGRSNALIVFVHGLRGDPKGSFTHEGARSWPELMAADKGTVRSAPPLSAHSIALLGYPSGRNDRLNIQEIAYRLLIEIDDGALFDSIDNVVFITHSLGGLVVKDLLVTAANQGNPILKKIAAIFFLSVPSKGAPAADWVARLLAEPLMNDLRPIDINHYLQVLDRSWEQLLRKRAGDLRPRIYCAYERQPTLGVSVVPLAYTSTICDDPPWPENKDHFGIAKPESTSDSIYMWVRGRIASLKSIAVADDPSGKRKGPVPSTHADSGVPISNCGPPERQPPPGSVKCGREIFVNDGTCGPGRKLKIVGGCNIGRDGNFIPGRPGRRTSCVPC